MRTSALAGRAQLDRSAEAAGIAVLAAEHHDLQTARPVIVELKPLNRRRSEISATCQPGHTVAAASAAISAATAAGSTGVRRSGDG